MIKNGIYKTTVKISCAYNEDSALDKYKKLVPLNDKKIIKYGIEVLKNSRVYDHKKNLVTLTFKILRNDFDVLSSFYDYVKEGIRLEPSGIPRETIFEPEPDCNEVVDEMKNAIESYRKGI
jgi:hypothetical protein